MEPLRWLSGRVLVTVAVAATAVGTAALLRDGPPSCADCRAFLPHASLAAATFAGATPGDPSSPEAPTAPPRTEAAGGSPTPDDTPGPAANLRVGALRCVGDREFVRVDNASDWTASLSGWRVRSVEGDQWFGLPERPLGAGTSLFVDSGPGPAPVDGDRVRWTYGHVWNNAGDEAELVDPDGSVVHRRVCPPEAP